MKYVDPESSQKAYKSLIIRFYERPDFISITARRKKNIRDASEL